MSKEKNDADSSLKVTRRRFLQGTALGAAGAAMSATGIAHAAERGHKPVAKEVLPAGKSKVVLIRNERAFDSGGRPQEAVIGEMLEQAMLELTGHSDSKSAWGEFVKPDDVVGVKMNVMITPTKPEVSRSVVRGIMQAGVPKSNIIVWDRDTAGYGLEGATVRGERFGYDSKALSKIVTDKATALVNVPGMKVHRGAGVGIALKNWVGAITNINPMDIGVSYKLHADSCAGCADIPAIPAIQDKSRLVVVDALQPLFHGGPQVNPRYLWPYRGILVGTDPVAVDTVCIRIFEARRLEYKGAPWPISPPPKHVYLAEEKYRLGHAKMENIELVKVGWKENALV
jgi:uncharacterized protein (DUF362 family)